MKQKKALIRKVLFGLLLLCVFIRPVVFLYQQRELFFYKGYENQYENLRRAYYTSQYVQKENPGIIPDQTFESFAGGAFLKGINPILINHDQPPLGRYLLAFSIFLFDNVSTIMVLAHAFSILGIFLISRMVIKNLFLSLIPIGIFINEPLFMNKLSNTPLLEPLQLPFIIFAIYFFILGITGEKYSRWFVLTALMLGFVISVRFFILGAFLILSMILYFFLERKILQKRFLVFLITLPISLIILIISYSKTLEAGYSVIKVLGIQKYIYMYHKSQLSLPFTFWDLLFFNKWHTWWGNYEIISDPQWIIVWPISMVLSLIFLLKYFFSKISLSQAEKVIFSWIFMYCVFLSLGISSTRYLIPLLPFLYILAVRFVMILLVR